MHPTKRLLNPLALGLALAAAAAAPAVVVAEEVAPAEALESNSCSGLVRLRGLEFDKGDATLDPSDTTLLDVVLTAMKERCLTQTIVIEGHTDASGSPKLNQQLSQRRADAVKAYFVAHGFPAGRLRAVGYGATRPLSREATPEAQALNRRVTLVVAPG